MPTTDRRNALLALAEAAHASLKAGAPREDVDELVARVARAHDERSSDDPRVHAIR